MSDTLVGIMAGVLFLSIFIFIIIEYAPSLITGIFDGIEVLFSGGYANYKAKQDAIDAGVAVFESDLNMSCDGPLRSGLVGRAYYACVNDDTGVTAEVYPKWGSIERGGVAIEILCSYTTTNGPGRVLEKCA